MDRYWHRLRSGVILGDALAICLAYTLAAGVRFGFGKLRVGGELWDMWTLVTVGTALLTIGIAWQEGTYRRWALLGGYRVYPALLTAATYGMVGAIILTYSTGGSSAVSPGLLLGSWAGSILSTSLSRLVWREVALRWSRKGLLVRKVLIAGASRQGIAVAEQLNDPARYCTRVLGFLDDYQRPGTEVIPGVVVVGHPQSVLEHANALGADEVIIIAGGLAWESLQQLAELVTRPDCPLEVRISPTFYDLLSTSAELSHVSYVPLLTLIHTRPSGINAVVKQLLDCSVAVAFLILLSPAWAYWRLKAWVLGVPMLMRQRVLGVHGHGFGLLGLHSRLTGSSVIARLPALWNVLCQDLSLVGPRPVSASEVTADERRLPNLFAMRPGLTGLWRLRARQVLRQDRVELDLYYVRNYSLILDIQILFSTVRELLRWSLGQRDSLVRWVSDGSAGMPSPSAMTESNRTRPGHSSKPSGSIESGVEPAS